MRDPIRVRDNETKHEYTIPASRFNKDAHTKIDRPALDAHGDVAPAKPHMPIAKKATESQAAQSVDPKKEN